MKSKLILLSGLIIGIIALIQCPALEKPFTGDDGKVIIKDRMGRTWDITHAVNEYKMDPDYFNFGIGVGSIPSVDDPKVIVEGQAGYLPDSDNEPVFGVEYGNEHRGYPVFQLSQHEVFNEHYPDSDQPDVSVAY